MTPPEFVPVPGLEDLFLVSEEGRVWSVRSHRELTQRVGSSGYLEVSTTVKPRVSKTYRVHRLVALAFLPNPDDLPLIHHVDNDKTNCHASNLVWSTWKQNAILAGQAGSMTRATGEDHPDAKLTEPTVRFLRRTYTPGCPFYGARALARAYEVSHSTILAAVSGRSWRCA